MDRAIELLNTFGPQLQQLAQQVGTEVFALAMMAIMVGTITTLVGNTLLAALGGFLLWGAWKMFKLGRAAKKADMDRRGYTGSDGDGWYMLSVAVALLGVILVVGGLMTGVLNAWNWAIIYDPRLYMAKKAFGL